MKAKKTTLPFVTFVVRREYRSRDGQWNPRIKEPLFAGGLQVNVFGRRKHYLQLAAFLKDFAERDTSDDGEYHDHFEGLMSVDGRVRLNVILRKDDVGDSAYSAYFPGSPAKSAAAKKKMTLTCGRYRLG